MTAPRHPADLLPPRFATLAVAIAGRSGSGKTALMEALVRELHARGLRVACVKRAAHGFEIDQEGKETWRLRGAGAAVMLISSESEVARIEHVESEWTLEELLALVVDCDVALVKGFRDAPLATIECLAPGELPRTAPGRLLAVISEAPVDAAVGWLRPSDTAAVADLISAQHRSIADSVS
ncbi:MAG TPA: molybdopterin-guanine dinucleotide biosynthesis protein B [Dehalococcoidia bacterium]|nr:molybdopterin-guanine dinucleotide biosynthesis protein B [Dehalococcoidia bacterium]